MDKLKKFVEEKRMDSKFKKAGGGHRLDEPSKQPSAAQQPRHSVPSAKPMSAASSHAGSAAASRFEQHQARTQISDNFQAKAFRSQVSQEMAAERAAQAAAERTAAARAGPGHSLQRSSSASTDEEAAMLFPVRFVCPNCLSSKPADDITAHIETCLQESIQREPLTTSACLIHTANKDKAVVSKCVETICRYIDNVIGHPGEQKYARIRQKNKAFQERVLACTGANNFLMAVGFESQRLPHEDGEEDFFVLSEEKAQDHDHLTVCREVLTSTEPLKPKLDRCLQLFRPSPKAASFHLPPSFFRLSADELKREQQRRKEEADRLTQLRTQAMRERDAMAAARNYRYAIVRVRLPDGNLLQGTFFPREPISAVRSFVYEALLDEARAFSLFDPAGKRVTNDSASLLEVHWVPHSVVSFHWDEQRAGNDSDPILKPHIMSCLDVLP